MKKKNKKETLKKGTGRGKENEESNALIKWREH